MMKDFNFRMIEFCTIIESLENVVNQCNEPNWDDTTKEVLGEVSDLITDQIYEKLKMAIGGDFITKFVNVKNNNHK